MTPESKIPTPSEMPERIYTEKSPIPLLSILSGTWTIKSEHHKRSIEYIRADICERELAQAREELDSLKQSILDLSHPNCKMLLKERDELKSLLAVKDGALKKVESALKKFPTPLSGHSIDCSYVYETNKCNCGYFETLEIVDEVNKALSLTSANDLIIHAKDEWIKFLEGMPCVCKWKYPCDDSYGGHGTKITCPRCLELEKAKEKV